VADLTQELAQLADALVQTGPEDLDGLARVGAELEALAGALPPGTPHLGALLNLVLEVLQRLFVGQAEDAVAELAAAQAAVAAGAQWSGENRARADELAVRETGQRLWLLLGRDPELVPFPAIAAGAPDAEHPTVRSAGTRQRPRRASPAPEASDDAEAALAAPPPAVGAASLLVLSLDDLTALLIGVTPDDQDELLRIRDGLRTVEGREAWSEGVAEAVTTAHTALTGLLEETALDPSVALAEAVSALAVVAELLAEEHLAAEMVGQPARSQASDPEVELPPAANLDVAPAADPAEPTCLEFAADPALLGEFVDECLEHLQQAELALLDIEVDPEDREALNAVFRGFHTIKGTAGFLGLPHIQKLAHHAEALLERARNGEISLTGGYADLALESADRLKGLIVELQDYAGTGPPPAPPDLEELISRLGDPESQGVSAEAPEVAPVVLRVGDILVAEQKATRQAVEAAARDPEGGRIGQKLVQHAAARTQDVAHALRAQKQVAEGAADGYVRVRTDRLDALLNMVGELVIANAMLVQDEAVQANAFGSLGRKASQLNKITRELQDLGMAMRMVPLRNTFQKMTRLVRDLSHKSGKEVQFVTEGEDTEIDRTMVETLGDPLLHMVRNAVDHGVEPPEQRRAAGKPEAGRVVLRAYQAAGSVVIELQDDGHGLDRQRILAKAIANGLVEEGRDLSDAEVYRLVFAAGLSTAEQVTDVSGRGVGMDVVSRNIEALRGRVDIASISGQGTTFTVRIPLTLAIMDGMLVRVGQERYIVPTASIQQSFQAEPENLATITGGGEMVVFRGEVIPVVRLHRLYRVAGAEERLTRGILLALDSDSGRYALLVDELLSQQQIVIKSLDCGLGRIPGVSGSAILSDGRVGLILDGEGLRALAQETGGDDTASDREERACAAPALV
jgi:two-component system, chemotaxis family, sensor kinase CheA